MNFFYFCLMGTELKYKVIKDSTQYDRYCETLALLLTLESNSDIQDEIELLTLLIHAYDDVNNTFAEYDPIKLLRSFMREHRLKASDLAALLSVSKGYISDILNYKKGLSKEVIRKLAHHFKVRQEAFNRYYPLSQ